MRIGITKKPPRSTVLVVDEVLGPWGEERPAYWRASVDTAEMIEMNPRNYGMYKRSRAKERFLAWIGMPLVVTVLVALLIFLTYRPTTVTQAISMACMGGVAAGVLIGFPAAKLIVATALQTEYLYVFGRIPKAKFSLFGLETKEGENEAKEYAIIPINPPPMLTGEEDDAATLVRETDLTLWRLDALGRGVDGWSTGNFIEVSIADKQRTDRKNQGRNAPPPQISLDRAPDQSVNSLPGGGR